MKFRDYCEFSRVKSIELAQNNIELELFQQAHIEYSIISDNVHCPKLNLVTRLKHSLEGNPRIEIENRRGMDSQVTFRPDTLDRPI